MMIEIVHVQYETHKQQRSGKRDNPITTHDVEPCGAIVTDIDCVTGVRACVKGIQDVRREKLKIRLTAFAPPDHILLKRPSSLRTTFAGHRLAERASRLPFMKSGKAQRAMLRCSTMQVGLPWARVC